VVVAGVLVALDAWLQGRQDAKSEASYLALLRRDLERSITDLESIAARTHRNKKPGTARRKCVAAQGNENWKW
jgi:hypothetical protein